MIRVHNLSKTYGKGTGKFYALKNIDLSINTGEFICIVGSSGSGKSTLLHILAGLDKPTEGEITFEKNQLYTMSDRKLSDLRRKKFGFVFQSFNLIPVLTVDENIKLHLEVNKDKIDKEYLNHLINDLGLKTKLNCYPNELSGGQQQRVAIARALIGKPNIIFADEPTGNLDSKSSKEVLNLLCKSIKKYKQTLIMVTHDLSIASYCDRVITLMDGFIVSDKNNDNPRMI